MTEFTCWNAEQLWAWVNSADYLAAEHIPISPIRAFSQVHNPRIKPEDILLITCFSEKKLVAYLGFLPDHWMGKPFAWMSCLWVKPDQRGKRLAQTLLEMGLDCWKQRLIATEFSPEAGKLYLKSQKFPIHHQQNGLRIFFRHHWTKRILERKPKLSWLKPVLQALDWLGNPIQNLRFPKSNVFFSAQTASAFQSGFHNNPFQRSTPEIQWILDYPWLKTYQNANEKEILASKKYYFSSLVEEFDMKILTKNNSTALVSYRDGHWKIPYLSGKEVHSEIVKYISQKGDMLTVYQPDFLATANEIPSIYKKKVQRNYLLSAGFLTDYTVHTLFQDGDGDCVFT